MRKSLAKWMGHGSANSDRMAKNEPDSPINVEAALSALRSAIS